MPANKIQTIRAIIEKLCSNGSHKKALQLIERSLEHSPNDAYLNVVKANILFMLEKKENALNFLSNKYALLPDSDVLLLGLANLYRSCYRYDEALVCYDKLIANTPLSFEAFYNKAVLLQMDRQEDSALANFRQALMINKRFTPAYMAIMRILKQRYRLRAAVLGLKRLVAKQPDNFEARMLLAGSLSDCGLINDALSQLQQIPKKSPLGLVAQANILYHLHLLPETTQHYIYNSSRSIELNFARKNNKHQYSHINSPFDDRKLRIGFVSGDFNLHPVSRHLKPVIESICRDRFELYAYNSNNLYDEITVWFKENVDHWRDIHGCSDLQAASQIRLDNIDILFDLSAYTGIPRLMIFTFKPAPIQISWIGYFNTTGLDSMDYLLADNCMVKQDEERFFSEKVLRMPYIRFCYDPRLALLPAVNSQLPVLNNGFITFGAFTKVNKLNDSLINRWSCILSTLPNAKLILKWGSFKDSWLVNDIKNRFMKCGVSEKALEIRQESDYATLLNEYTNDIDIALDTYPHSGGSTSCDALLMGVPVVTLSGMLPISRQTEGFLNLMGLADELVCFSEEEFIQKTILLAQNIPKLQELRNTLRERFINSKICDTQGFTSDFENLMLDIWKKWCDGKSVVQLLQQKKINSDELYNEGVTLMLHGKNHLAVSYFKRALEFDKKNVLALNNLGICLWNIGNLADAAIHFEKAVKISPKSIDIIRNISNMYIEFKKYEKALNYAEHGLIIQPEDEDLVLNKLLIYIATVKSEKAFYLLQSAKKLFPRSLTLWGRAGNLYGSVGNISEAINCYNNALKIDSHQIQIYSNKLMMLNYTDTISSSMVKNTITKMANSLPKENALNRHIPAVKISRLKIGLITADLQYHPGGRLLEQFLKYYNHEKLEIFCYYNRHIYIDITRRIQASVDHWREVYFLDDNQLYNQIREDQPDILIDLNGHTDGNRLKLFSMKPCAIQATWLGYFNTTGLSAIDYFISDEFTTPLWMQKYFSEKIVCLPHSRFCYSQPEYSPLVSLSPAEWQGYITFGAYNNIAKISDTTLKMWAEIIKKIPKSRIVLKWRAFRDKGVRETMYKRFEEAGIKRYRVSLRRDSKHSQMLADYSDLDIVLDTYPFNGGMTSLEALWMGVPIVTMAGKTPASRQTGSFLRLLGLDDLITYKPEKYVEAVINLANDRDRLYDIRGTLRQRMLQSPLMDGELFARNMEELLFKIYNEQVEKQQAAELCKV